METIGLGIIGCGDAARRYHTPALRHLSGIEIRSLYDAAPQAAHQFAKSFPEAVLAKSVEGVLTRPGIHAVAILSPPHTHFELAMQALGAGKHVLVEKPLALEASHAEQLEQAAVQSGCVCAVGYHLRNHRFVTRAREIVQSGEIGRVRVARSLWCSRLVPTLPSNSWRKDETLGGSALEDAGVHHIDLLRFLLASEFREVCATVSDTTPQGTHVEVTATMAGGTSAEIVIVQGQFEWQEIELIGEKGRIRLPLYDAWGFEALTHRQPVFGLGARLHRLTAQTAEILPGLNAQRQGGDLALCYRAQWKRFRDAIRGQGEPAANFADGLACVRVVGQARGKVTREILLRPEKAPRTAAVSDEPGPPRYGTPRIVGEPELSVVLASPDSFLSLRTTLRHLHAQTARDRIELVLVGPKKLQETIDESYLHPFPSYQVVDHEPVRTIAAANAAGARAARGRIIAFAEDHCFPEPGWAEALVAAHRNPHAVVGPVVRNANPSTWISWADFLAGYGPWMAGAVKGHPGFLPGHNSSYKREVLEDLGGDLEEWLEAETILHQKLAADGHSLYLEQGAIVSHVNFALLDSWADVQFLNGRVFAGMRSRDWGVLHRLVYFLASPLIPLVRTARSVGPLHRAQIPAGRKLQTLAGLTFGMCVDGFGQMVGYASGPGSARRSLARLEFHRSRHIPARERDEIFV